MLALSAASCEWQGRLSLSATYETEAEKSVPAVNTAQRLCAAFNFFANLRIPSLSFKSTGIKISAREAHNAAGFPSTAAVVNPNSFAARSAGFCISPAPKIKTVFSFIFLSCNKLQRYRRAKIRGLLRQKTGNARHLFSIRVFLRGGSVLHDDRLRQSR